MFRDLNAFNNIRPTPNIIAQASQSVRTNRLSTTVRFEIESDFPFSIAAPKGGSEIDGAIEIGAGQGLGVGLVGAFEGLDGRVCASGSFVDGDSPPGPSSSLVEAATPVSQSEMERFWGKCLRRVHGDC